ncbi:TetR family transcriptional regulator [Nocardia sp. NPDC088792]|uniref:acyl-CoA-like ligand-binding transcription factor n=1 Tax=Nocardia sp. NPDC088792 TaxID=3364332 RepID=UPI00382E1635
MAAELTQGLRERKKASTRRKIRTEAFRLFRKQGYAETTVDQIAAAAKVSSRTFFRYFQNKEQVVLDDDLDPLLVRMVVMQPAGLSVTAAFRAAAEQLALDPPEEQFEADRLRLLYTEPELRGGAMTELRRNIDLLSQVIAQRSDREPSDRQVRMFAGACVGALLSVTDELPDELDYALQVLDFFDAGMPL